MKKAIEYRRFSTDGQSNSSIERQEMIIKHWCRHNQVELVDSFTDEGYSARNFDRPDVKELFEFIKKNFHYIDYLVVSELSRFSRDLADAVNMVKKIQTSYGIRIVSADRNTIYDITNDSSFFMMSLEFLLGNQENIKRTNDINGGIYTAKAVEGRYIHGKPPYGYTKEGSGKNAKLIIHERQAYIIRYIFQSYLHNVPQNIIQQRANEMGLTMTGNSAILGILSNPIYTGRQQVKSWKDKIGGLFNANHAAIIDIETFDLVQQKINGKPAPNVSLSDNFPLRGVLKCHCQQPLTGAPSRGRSGKYYNYYKCNRNNHLNLNTSVAHRQFDEVLQTMSLSQNMVTAIRQQSELLLKERYKMNRDLLNQKRGELDKVQQLLVSVEEKFLLNDVTTETYYRWFQDCTQKKSRLNEEIGKLSRDENELWLLFRDNLDKLTNLQAVYHHQQLPEKQQLVRMVFDNSLYYHTDRYRTKYIMSVFSHNLQLLKEKQLLEIDESEHLQGKPLSGGGDRITIEPLADLLYFIQQIKTA